MVNEVGFKEARWSELFAGSNPEGSYKEWQVNVSTVLLSINNDSRWNKTQYQKLSIHPQDSRDNFSGLEKGPKISANC